MKFTLFFLVLFTISSCANQTRRRGVNLSDIENETQTEVVEEETTEAGEDRAPKGEIELGITGEASETVVIENGDEPVVEEVAAEAAEAVDKKVSADPKKIDCKKDPKHKSCSAVKIKVEKPEEKPEEDSDLILDKPPE